jgi:hypothetical protein
MSKQVNFPAKVLTLIIPQDIGGPCPPTGEIGNWNGKLVLLDRNRLIKNYYEAIDNLARPGVYLLIGYVGKVRAIYVGEGEAVIKRVRRQRKMDFWKEVLIFYSKDDSVNKAGIKYLEHKIFKILQAAGIFHLVNPTVPTLPLISAAEKAQLDEALGNILNLGRRLTEYPF